MNKIEIKEQCIQLQNKYFARLEEQNPSMDRIKIKMLAYPPGWFLSKDYEEKSKILQKSIDENKLVTDYEETFILLHPDFDHLHDTVETDETTVELPHMKR